jgi:ATP-binding cassette, subfamily F, member 3
LLLDEPTYHLDLGTREALSIALNEFEGTVMLVSHDRALLREVCDEFWLVTRGGVEPFDGDLDDYQRWLLEVSRALAKGQAAPPPPRPTAPAVSHEPVVQRATAAAAAPPRQAKEDRQASKQARARQSEATRPLRVEIQRIDERVARLTAERAEVEAQLSTPGVKADDLAELGRRLAHIGAEVGMLEERWLAAHTELESLQAPS